MTLSTPMPWTETLKRAGLTDQQLRAAGVRPTQQPANGLRVVASPSENTDAEEAILGAVMLDNAAHAEAVKAGLREGDFFLDSNRRIWRGMTAMLKSGGSVDIVTLSEELTSSKQIQMVGGVAYLASLTEGLPRLPRVAEYAAIVKGKARKCAALRVAASVRDRVGESDAAITEAAREFTALANDGAATEIGSRPDLVRLSDVPSRAVDWLWEPFIPARMLSMISGDPGTGKSFIALSVCADLTRGKLRDGRIVDPANCLYLSVENPLPETIRPRFDLLGGDASRLIALQGTIFAKDGEEQRGAITLADTRTLEDAIAKTQARLIVVDPIQSYFGQNVDLHRSNETRPVLDGLSKLAEAHGCAILLLRHLSKQGGGKAITRGLGSIDLSGAVRSEMLAGSLPDDPESRALVHIKSNVGRMGHTIAYLIDDQGRFSWTGESSITTADLLAAPESEARSTVDRAKEWLTDLLRSGSKGTKEIFELAEAEGFKEKTIRRAKNALNIESRKATFGGGWIWWLPANEPENEAVL